MLEVKGVSKSFGSKEILKNVSFQCKTGEILGIFGRNGSGKSSLLKIIFGTLKADAISIKVDSVELLQKKIIYSETIAYLPQEPFLPKEMKVRNVIPMFFPKGEDQDKIFYAKGIHSFENKKVGNLSLGELRFLEILLIGNLGHKYLMLDEPFSMIEPLYKDIIKEFLLNLKEQKGIILTDHYYEDVLSVTNRNFLLKDGKIMDVKTKKDLEIGAYLKS